MSVLIYRGILHTGTKARAPRLAHALLYRGVPHDGLSPRPANPADAVAMCYRGVRYTSEFRDTGPTRSQTRSASTAPAQDTPASAAIAA